MEFFDLWIINYKIIVDIVDIIFFYIVVMFFGVLLLIDGVLRILFLLWLLYIDIKLVVLDFLFLIWIWNICIWWNIIVMIIM